MKIATSITEQNIEKAINNALHILQNYNDLIIELRADYLDEINENNLTLFRNKIKAKLIFTLREPNEGGKRQYELNQKIKILLLAQKVGFDLIDCELQIFEKLDFSQQSKFDKERLILSYHDFNKTPTQKEIKTTYQKMLKYNPEIVKLAFTINSQKDLQKIYSLMISTSHKKVIIGMGEKGKITRIIGPILGCEFTFAANEFYTSAPGQINVRDMYKIYEEIKKPEINN